MNLKKVEMSQHKILLAVKSERHDLNLPSEIIYDLCFLEALFIGMATRLVVHPKPNGWFNLSQDASVKIKTLMDFMEDRFSIEGFEFLPELNGLKYSDLSYSCKYNLSLHPFLVIECDDFSLLNSFADRFKAV